MVTLVLALVTKSYEPSSMAVSQQLNHPQEQTDHSPGLRQKNQAVNPEPSTAAEINTLSKQQFSISRP